MASYEELKARVAALKREDKDDSKARKAIAAREAAEVARAKADLLSREKENASRLQETRASLNQATERSRRMRLTLEDQIRKLKKDVERKDAALARAAETAAALAKQHEADLARALASRDAANAEATARLDAELRETRDQLRVAEAKSVRAYDALQLSEADAVTRAETAEATVAALSAKLEAAEAAKVAAERRLRDETATIAARFAAEAAETREAHRAQLAAVDERVRATMEKLLGERAHLKAQIRAGQDREAAMSRVLTNQAARMLGE